MSVAGEQKWSLHLEPAESSRLVWAFVISMMIHALIFGGYYTGKKFNVWETLHWPAWLRPVQHLVEHLKPKEHPTQPKPPEEEVPLMFVDVSPAVATPEPPKTAKFYSDKNSVAANPEPDQNATVPKITGSQQEMVKTEDVPRENFVPFQPARPPRPVQPKQEEMIPKTTLNPGDLTMAKPDLVPKKGEGQDTHARPRTIEEALARQTDRRLPGQKMKEEGGVRHRLEIASLDTKATPMGTYDAALVEAIQQCWYGLLDSQQYAADYRGKVVLQFHLHSDGRITDVTVAENTAGAVPGLICETAIDKPNPYPPFPGDMRRVVGETRSIQFTFFYN
jgi:hypothetical protein